MIISIASGKGGTGKTLIATSLAFTLKERGKVRILDCDVEEPNDHILLKPLLKKSVPVNIRTPSVDQGKCTHCGKCAEVCRYNAIAVFPKYTMVFPQLCHGCGACSYLCPENAISEVDRATGIVEYGRTNGLEFIHGKLNVGEAMPTTVIRKVKENSDINGLAIIDAPPGTSCSVVESIKGSNFCILVTESTPFGFHDLELAACTVREMAIPFGIVMNRYNTDYKKIEEYTLKQNIPVLMKIPFDLAIARNYSRGITLAEGIPSWKKEFIGLYMKIKEFLAERNRGHKR